MRIRVLDIVEGTSVDGPGLRTSIYLAGCHHRCPGCHNPESWAMDGGREATVDELLDTIRYNDFNVTLSGGDPLYHPKRCGTVPAHQAGTGKNRLVFYGFHLGRDTSRPGIAASAAMDRRGGRRTLYRGSARHAAALPRQPQPAHRRRCRIKRESNSGGTDRVLLIRLNTQSIK